MRLSLEYIVGDDSNEVPQPAMAEPNYNPLINYFAIEWCDKWINGIRADEKHVLDADVVHPYIINNGIPISLVEPSDASSFLQERIDDVVLRMDQLNINRLQGIINKFIFLDGAPICNTERSLLMEPDILDAVINGTSLDTIRWMMMGRYRDIMESTIYDFRHYNNFNNKYKKQSTIPTARIQTAMHTLYRYLEEGGDTFYKAVQCLLLTTDIVEMFEFMISITNNSPYIKTLGEYIMSPSEWYRIRLFADRYSNYSKYAAASMVYPCLDYPSGGNNKRENVYTQLICQAMMDLECTRVGG